MSAKLSGAENVLSASARSRKKLSGSTNFLNISLLEIFLLNNQELHSFITSNQYVIKQSRFEKCQKDLDRNISLTRTHLAADILISGCMNRQLIEKVSL